MFRGWILDVYPVAEGMCVWIIDDHGRAAPWIDRWSPGFYLDGNLNAGSHLHRLLAPLNTPFSIQVQEKKDFFSGSAHHVVEVRVGNPLAYNRVVKRLLNANAFTLYNADLNLPQYFMYERGIFPMAHCAVETHQGEIRAWHLEDSPWRLDYPLAPMRFMHWGLDTLESAANHHVNLDPAHKRKGQIIVTLGAALGEGETYVLDSNPADLIRSLNRHVADWDPDIILTDWGDRYLFPRIMECSRLSGIAPRFSRDPQRHIKESSARMFFSYGKIIHRAGDRTLYGRLHIDTRNSFVMGHTELDGLIEISRVAKIPLQRAARSTIGTSLSSIQHEWAIRNNFLIPLDKGQTEDFRPADDLLLSDRGGLVYEPELGWHEDLIEFDFASMYPEIMIRHNVTPEAINCACCPDNKVPEINHHICRHRIGMMPHILAPIVRKRQKYKELIRDGHPQSKAFTRRREAFKWALVTCFGYLGFRNARFGRIEAHECVNAYSREALLKAKEVAEENGFHFVHGIVDSLWLRKPGVTEEETEALRKKIEMATGLPLGYEGRYRWIRFCSSRQNVYEGVPNKYFGAFQTGAIKVRGIELRRHDTPPLIKALQHELLDAMAQAQNLKELNALNGKIAEIVDLYRDRLSTGAVEPAELAISLQLTQRPEDYVHNTLSAIAAKKLAASGVDLEPGEMIQYVVVEEHDKVKDWRVTPLAFIDDGFEYDRAYYRRLLDRAISITPFYPDPLLEKKRRNAKITTVSRQLEFPGMEI